MERKSLSSGKNKAIVKTEPGEIEDPSDDEIESPKDVSLSSKLMKIFGYYQEENEEDEDDTDEDNLSEPMSVDDNVADDIGLDAESDQDNPSEPMSVNDDVTGDIGFHNDEDDKTEADLKKNPVPKQKKPKDKPPKTLASPKTPTGRARTRPRSQKSTPCPCPHCPKIFPKPSILRRHMTIHTGEKAFECSQCHKRFRTQELLTNHILSIHNRPDPTKNSTFKCRICGLHKFKRNCHLRTHQVRFHPHIPYETESAKAFACAICGKPHFIRIKAAICALLGHDPTSLQKQMFSRKCPQCPPGVLGFHNRFALRRHWEATHSDKPLPLSINTDNLIIEDCLPVYRIDKAKADKLKEDGIPPEVDIKEVCVDLDLLGIPAKEWYLEGRSGEKLKKDSPVKTWKCHLCDNMFAYRSNLFKHVKKFHDGAKVIPLEPAFKCEVCQKFFKKLERLKEHERSGEHKMRVMGRKPVVRRRRRRRKVLEAPKISEGVVIKTEPVDGEEVEDGDGLDVESAPVVVKVETVEVFANEPFSCRVCQRGFGNLRALRLHEIRAHEKSWSTRGKGKSKKK